MLSVCTYTHPHPLSSLSCSFFLFCLRTRSFPASLPPQLFMSTTWNRLQYLIKAWSLIWVAWEVHFIFISHQRLMEDWGGYPLCDCWCKSIDFWWTYIKIWKPCMCIPCYQRGDCVRAKQRRCWFVRCDGGGWCKNYMARVLIYEKLLKTSQYLQSY